MEKETNKFKLKLSKIFSSSCITQDISKVIDHQKPPLFTPKTPLLDLEQHEHEHKHEHEQEEDDYDYDYDYDNENNLFSYPPSVVRQPHHHKQTPLLGCKPRCPESFDQMVRESCLVSRRKVAGKYTLLSPSGDSFKCPPVSPASPLFHKKTKKKKKKKRTKNGVFNNKMDKTHFRNHNPFSFSSSNDTDWFSSDDEREEEVEKPQRTDTTLFPSFHKSISLSLSSDSEPRRRNRVRSRRKREISGSGSSRFGSKREEKEDTTFAVVKSSSDPYSDFRTSMAEMIIEKQIFGEEELEKLLECFLSLNSTHHHRVIVEVFTEIWDALFSHCS